MGDASANVYNQAIIEFGALQCTAKNPDCENCPLQVSCFAYINKQQDNFPVKKKKIKLIDRYFYYLYIYSGDRFLMQQRDDTGIWRKLFEYPLIETEKRTELVDLFNNEDWKTLIKDKSYKVTKQITNKVHKLSHQNLHIEFIHIEMKEEDLDTFSPLLTLEKESLASYPMPKPIERHSTLW